MGKAQKENWKELDIGWISQRFLKRIFDDFLFKAKDGRDFHDRVFIMRWRLIGLQHLYGKSLGDDTKIAHRYRTLCDSVSAPHSGEFFSYLENMCGGCACNFPVKGLELLACPSGEGALLWWTVALSEYSTPSTHSNATQQERSTARQYCQFRRE